MRLADIEHFAICVHGIATVLSTRQKSILKIHIEYRTASVCA